MTRERRKFKRIAMELPVEFKKKGKNGKNIGRAILVRTKNISQGGIFISSANTFKPKTILELKVMVKPHGPTIAMTAEVIWVAKKVSQPTHYPGMGVRVIAMSKKDCAQFIKFCAQKVASYKDARELKDMYLYLKSLVSRLIELEERHTGAVHFKKAIENAIRELDDVAHLLDRETREVKRL